MLVTNSSCFSEGAAQLPHQQVNDELSWLREASTALVPGDYLPSHDAAADFDVPAGMSLEQIEKQAIRNALHLNKGNREATAKMLNIGERTLYRKLKEYGLK